LNSEFELDVKYVLDGWKYRIEHKKDLDELKYSTYNDGNKKISFYDTPLDSSDYVTTILLINDEVIGFCYYQLQNRKGKKVYMIGKITIDLKHRRKGYSLLIQKHINEIFPEYDFFYTNLNMSALGELAFKKNKDYIKYI